ncbi:hypothetical protein OF83DRAFT_1155161 [Amylostereum chailletii]|nr:hypothetical protein OF83DRAFT_1155161 [Amylostereum chailletii]
MVEGKRRGDASASSLVSASICSSPTGGGISSMLSEGRTCGCPVTRRKSVEERWRVCVRRRWRRGDRSWAGRLAAAMRSASGCGSRKEDMARSMSCRPSIHPAPRARASRAESAMVVGASVERRAAREVWVDMEDWRRELESSRAWGSEGEAEREGVGERERERGRRGPKVGESTRGERVEEEEVWRLRERDWESEERWWECLGVRRSRGERGVGASDSVSSSASFASSALYPGGSSSGSGRAGTERVNCGVYSGRVAVVSEERRERERRFRWGSICRLREGEGSIVRSPLAARRWLDGRVNSEFQGVRHTRVRPPSPN